MRRLVSKRPVVIGAALLLLSVGALGEVYGTYSDANGEHDFKFPPHLFTTLGIETSY